MMRSFDTTGNTCPVYGNEAGVSIIALTQWGQIIMYVNGGIQLVMSLFSLCLACTWFFSKTPLLPAMRMMRDPTYFMTLICDSPFTVFLVGTNNAPKHVIWQALDQIARIGETIDTLQDQIGHIKLERYTSFIFTFPFILCYTWLIFYFT